MQLVYGVGVNDRTVPTRLNGKRKLEYKTWQGMLERCYSEKLHKKRPTYIGCETGDKFKHYTYFHDWCRDQIGFGQDGFELDKDILIKNNKMYSEDTCVFVPIEINSMMTKTNSKRGLYPIGVSFYKKMGKFIAKQRCKNNDIHLGYFNNPSDAFNAYKKEREIYIKQVAEEYKHLIDDRAYNALMNYQVGIFD